MPLFGRKKAAPAPVEQPPAPTLPPGPPPNADGLRSMSDHRDYLLGLVEPLTAFGVQLLDAPGLALCEDVVAPGPLPMRDTATTDGYAVAAADVARASQGEPVTLEVAAPSDDLADGTAQVVAGGRRLPHGADAVLPPPFTDRGERHVKVFEPVAVGENVRLAGTDVEAGTVLAHTGQSLDARTVGLLAGMGIDKVLASPRPRVVVLSTGEHLVEPGLPLVGEDDIHDANGFLIAAAAQAEGCQVWRVPVLGADPEQIRETVTDQLIRADLIISTGGVTERDYEVIKQVLPDLGLTDFAEVAMSPGRPQGFGLIGDDKVPMIMLPGNPVSAYVSFEAFVRPVIRKLMGVDPTTRSTVRAVARSVIRSNPGVAQLQRAIVTTDHGRSSVEVVQGGVATMLGDLARCNALVVLDEDTEVVQAGQTVTCWLLDRG